MANTPPVGKKSSTDSSSPQQEYRYVDYSRIPVPADQDTRSSPSPAMGRPLHSPYQALPSTEAASAAGVLPHGASAEEIKSGLPVSFDVRVLKLPSKLAAMLDNPDINHIITWMPHGRSWKILRPKDFSRDVAPKYFEYPNYNSFIRLVNAWGFRRITTGIDSNCYFHELFLRGMPHLHQKMRRLSKNEKKQAMNPNEEPDFYAMPPVGAPPTQVSGEAPQISSGLRPAASPTTAGALPVSSSAIATAPSPQDILRVNEQSYGYPGSSMMTGTQSQGIATLPVQQQSSSFLTSQNQSAMLNEALSLDALRRNQHQTSLISSLNYSPSTIQDPGYIRESRLRDSVSNQQRQNDLYLEALRLARLEQQQALEQAYRTNAAMRQQRLRESEALSNLGPTISNPEEVARQNSMLLQQLSNSVVGHSELSSMRQLDRNSSDASASTLRRNMMLQHQQQLDPELMNVESRLGAHRLGISDYAAQLTQRQLQLRGQDRSAFDYRGRDPLQAEGAILSRMQNLTSSIPRQDLSQTVTTYPQGQGNVLARNSTQVMETSTNPQAVTAAYHRSSDASHSSTRSHATNQQESDVGIDRIQMGQSSIRPEVTEASSPSQLNERTLNRADGKAE